MKRLVLTVLALLSIRSAALGYNVVWGVSQNRLIYCYPSDNKGHALSGSYPVSDTYCLATYGAEWGRGVDGRIRCYPRRIQGMVVPRFPVGTGWCAQ